MTINEKKSTIEMSKKFANAAKKFGTPEYKDLQAARRDYPTFKVVTVTRKSSAKKETFKGLTYDYMEMYIEMHDDENNSAMAEYKMLRATSEEAKAALAVSASYMEIKEWFLNKFPAIAEFHKKREALLVA